MPIPAPESLQYRQADRDDLPDIIALLNDDVFGQARNPLFDEARTDYEAAFAAMRVSKDNVMILTETTERLVGCYQLTFIHGLSHRGALRAQIESVRIVGELRGQGLGSMLIRDAISRAQMRGARMIQLTTDIRRVHARKFYERLGFIASHHGMKMEL